MIEKLKETKSVWQHLKETDKPIFMYGMGDGALKIMNVFDKYGIKLEGIFASDDFQRGHSFMGFPIRKLSYIEENYSDFIIVLAFGTFREPLLSYLYNLSEKHEFYAPDVPVCIVDDVIFDLDYVKKYEKEFDKVYDLLCDEKSKQVMLDILNFKISGKISYLKSCETDVEEIYDSIIKLDDNEDYVDLGAYNGDTVVQFLNATNGKFSSITAFEPDKKNYKKLLKQIEKLGLNDCDNVKALNYGSYSKKDVMLFSNKAGRNSTLNCVDGIETIVDSVDNVTKGNRVSVLKFDVEGAEEESIIGSTNTIKKYKPNILLSAYHKNSDLFLLPLLINELYDGYKIYLRHHPYIPAWETNFYFINK